MDSGPLMIGRRLRELRARRNLTLDEAARLTGVSKPMLGQIERGQSSPTVNTLFKIATGLKVPLSSFLEEQKAEYTVSAPRERELIAEEEGRMRAWPLFPYDPIRNVEIFYIEFDSGCRHASEGHLDGVEEYLLVLRGGLELTLNDRTVPLTERQAIRFQADVPHVYCNPGGECCCAYNLIFYPGFVEKGAGMNV
jgi:transcriptional regulator with XRE-family HTH domain